MLFIFCNLGVNQTPLALVDFEPEEFRVSSLRAKDNPSNQTDVDCSSLVIISLVINAITVD